RLTFLLTLRPPPMLTLFPYTTLFRSDLALRRARLRRAGVAVPAYGRRVQLPLARTGTRRGLPVRVGAHERHSDRRHRCGGVRVRDRKSTRLNSSHVKISYAVFCLKKK